MKKFLSTFIIISAMTFAFAQDIHFSQYWGSPLNLNPALTGVFNNDNVRFNANYRNQWFSQNSFTTYAVAVDANLWRKKMKGNFIGAGIGFYHDLEGNGAFSNTSVNLSLSYNQKIAGNFKTNHYIGLGLQAVYFSKAINVRDAIYGNLYEQGTNFDPIDVSSFNNTSIMDFNIGLSYFSSFNKLHNVGAGIAISHIAEQDIAFEGAENDVLYRKITAHASATVALDKGKVGIIPTMLFQKQGPHSEMDIGAYLRFELNKNRNSYFYAGAQYRMSAFSSGGYNSDAFIPGVRFEFLTLDAGFAYDVTVSDLRNANGFMGGPEIYVIYTIPTNSRDRNFMNCPKF